MNFLTRRQLLHLAAGVAAFPAVARIERAQAQDYPARPVRIITHSAAGGAPDALLRIVADRLSQKWGKQVVVVNRPGAGGAVAARAAAAATADGYTLYMPASSAFVTLPGLQANLPLELPRDFVPVGFVASQPFLLSVVSSLGVKTLPQFIALAKQKPGEFSYAATGRGTLTHLTGEALQQRAGIKLNMVPYLGGTAQALSDVSSGRVPMVIWRSRARCRPAPSGRLPSARPNAYPTFRTCLPRGRPSLALVPLLGSRLSPQLGRPTRLYTRSATTCARRCLIRQLGLSSKRQATTQIRCRRLSFWRSSRRSRRR